jgi:hypothetical protein
MLAESEVRAMVSNICKANNIPVVKGPDTAEELLGRVNLATGNGSGIGFDPPGSILSPYSPKRAEKRIRKEKKI